MNKILNISKCLIAVGLVLPLAGCVAQRTTTEGNTTTQEYVIKRPFKQPTDKAQEKAQKEAQKEK